MNGSRSTGREYTGKHRRDSGPGLADPVPWAGRAEWYDPLDGRPVPGATPRPATRPEPRFRPESGFRPETGPWTDAGLGADDR
jgi:hypothetical protein